MPTTTKRSSARSPAHALAPEAQLASMPGLEELLRELGLWADVDDELAECMPPRLASSPPTKAQQRAGVSFSVEEVRRYLTMCRKLRHYKGAYAGRPLIPDMWQVLYIDAPLYGWRRADGNRLYSTLWEEIPRKNGKSTSSAGKGLYHLTADSNLKAGRLAEPGAEVYAAATTTDQARQVFRPAEQMTRRSPALARRLGIVKDKTLVYEANASRFEVLSGASDKAEEKMGLNGSAIIIDEVHVHKTRLLIDTLDSSTASRDQPVTIFITTAGVDDPGSIYTEKRDYAEKVAKGELDDEAWLVCIYTIDDGDDPFDESTWAKANPGQGRSVQLDYLRRKAREAKASPAALNTFLRLHLNVRTGQVTRWVPVDVFDKSGSAWLTVSERDVAGRAAFGGLDLSSAVDLTAAVFVIPKLERVALDPDHPKKLVDAEVLDVVVRAWTPQATLVERERRDRAPYQRWVKEGLLLTCPGETIDYDDIERELFLLAGGIPRGFERLASEEPYRGVTLTVKALNFDRWGSKQIRDHLADGGLEMWEMGQGFADMSAPMKEAERLMRQRRIRSRHPLLRWALGSLAVKQDAAGNVKPDREHSTGRIDVFVAFVMAVGAWMRAGQAKPEKSKEVVSW